VFGAGVNGAVSLGRTVLVEDAGMPGSQPVTFRAMRRGKTTPLIQAFLDVFQGRARQLGRVNPKTAIGLTPRRQDGKMQR